MCMHVHACMQVAWCVWYAWPVQCVRYAQYVWYYGMHAGMFTYRLRHFMEKDLWQRIAIADYCEQDARKQERPQVYSPKPAAKGPRPKAQGPRLKAQGPKALAAHTVDLHHRP